MCTLVGMRRVLGSRTLALAGLWIAMACADEAPAAGSPAADGGPCAAPSDAENLPTDLLDTGCMSKFQTDRARSGSDPYEVNSPLWSDGADKLRGLHLPKGGKIKLQLKAASGASPWARCYVAAQGGETRRRPHAADRHRARGRSGRRVDRWRGLAMAAACHS